MFEMTLISEFVNSEIRISSTFRASCQDGRVSFRKTSNVNEKEITFELTWVIAMMQPNA